MNFSSSFPENLNSWESGYIQGTRSPCFDMNGIIMLAWIDHDSGTWLDKQVLAVRELLLEMSINNAIMLWFGRV
jgi:hypothetical protein